MLALLVNLSARQEFLLVRSIAFGQQRGNARFNFVDLLGDPNKIGFGSRGSFVHSARVVVQFQQPVQFGNPLVDVGLGDFIFADKSANFTLDVARFAFCFPKLAFTGL